MQDAGEQNAPVKAKAVLVDPESMTVVWMNESALRDYSEPGRNDPFGLPVEQAVPMAEAMGVPAALRVAAATGETQHLRTGLVSTAKGSMMIATSICRLPDGKLLMLTEHAWQMGRGPTGASSSRRSGDRAR